MYSFNIYSLLSLAAALSYLFLVFFVLLKNSKSPVNRFFALFGLAMFIWGLGEGMMRAAVNPETAYFWGVYVADSGSCLFPVFLLHFWLIFSGRIKRFREKMPIFTLYLPALFFTIIRYSRPEILFKGLTHGYWGYSTNGTPFNLFYIFYVLAYTFVVIYLISKTASKSHGKVKKQTQYMEIGLILSFFVGIITEASWQIFHFPVPELTVTSTMIFVGLIAFAIDKYGLMTISTKLVAENIIDTMEDYVIAIDRQMKIALINNSALWNLGYKKEELTDKPVSTILSADISNLSYDQAMKRFPLQNYQAEIISKKGDKISVFANVSALEEGPNNTFGFVFVLRDMRQINKLIEDLRVAKTGVEKIVVIRTKELQEERARLTASINSLSVGFSILDKKFNVFLSNNVLKDTLELKKNDELTFQDIEEQFMKCQFDLKAQCEKCLREKNSVDIKEIVFIDKSLRIFLTPIATIHDSNETIGITILIEDITEQKRLDEAKTSFVAITAHELRTPLTIIRGNAELLLRMFPEKITDPQIKTMIDAVQRSRVRLLGIVNDLLELTTLEEHRVLFKNEPFDLTSVVTEVIADLQIKAEAKSLSLTVVPSRESLPEIFADRDRAKEIVINLLGNAIQYTEKGGVTLSTEKGDGFVELSIKDTGIGIKPDDQKSLFQKFQTVGTHFTRSKEYGSGMGLYIAHFLAESMGGKVRLKESISGVGSTFVVTFSTVDNKSSIVV